MSSFVLLNFCSVQVSVILVMHPLTCFNGHAGAPKATHCMACKEEGMINVVSRKCHCGRAVPNFGAAGQKKRTHCAQCKEPGMVNLSKNPAARQPLPQIPVPPPMIMSPQDPMMGMHPHHQVSMGQQVLPHCLWTVLGTCTCNYSCPLSLLCFAKKGLWDS